MHLFTLTHGSILFTDSQTSSHLGSSPLGFQFLSSVGPSLQCHLIERPPGCHGLAQLIATPFLSCAFFVVLVNHRSHR